MTSGGRVGESDEAWREYVEWARENIGGSEAQITSAARALVDAKRAGANAQQAANAARAAAAEAAAAPVPSVAPAPPGMVAGIARQVQQTTQFSGAEANLQVLNFELDRPGDRPVRVQIRGALLYGVVNDGDEVVVERPPGTSGFIQTDSVFNRTTNSEVKAQKGFTAGLSSAEARWGKAPARAGCAVQVVIVVFVLLIFTFVIGSIVSGPSSPTWWCDGASSAGWEDPPGC
jgi:hypothetical protein